MKNKVKRLIVFSTLIELIITSVVLAKTEGFVINNTSTFENKQNSINAYFESDYNIINNNQQDDDKELREQLIELTKKTTYLLLGEANAKEESSEDYYKRHKDYLNLRYNPDVPEDSSNVLGLDMNSQEYKDDVLSGITVPTIFLKMEELGIKYSSFGDIKVSIIDDNKAVGEITLPDVTIKEQDEEDPMKYNLIQTDLNIYYTFKKLNGEFKLLFLYGETNDKIKQELEKGNENVGTLSKNSDYNSQLEDVYDFSKSDAVTDETINKIYANNNSNIVYLNSEYNLGVVATANGFFINKGIIVTTYNYIEQTLLKAQTITIRDSDGNIYELEDIAVLKIKNANNTYVEIQNNDIQKEDAIISINSKNGVGLSYSKGIIIVANKEIQTSIPITSELQGSPLFDTQGKLVGMINSQKINSNISYATKANIIKQYYDKFSNVGYENIKSVPFEELKEKYYIKYKEENIVNNVPNDKIKEFSKIDNINEVIGLDLVKGSYKNNIITLRYKNNVHEYINTMQITSSLRVNLKNNGFNEKYVSDSKIIYENGKNQIIIMKEFDYLIIVMVKV